MPGAATLNFLPKQLCRNFVKVHLIISRPIHQIRKVGLLCTTAAHTHKQEEKHPVAKNLREEHDK